jgi:hypothetical protein
MLMPSSKWMEIGMELHGSLGDCPMILWKFVCPICGVIQTGEDFRRWKDRGARPADAFRRCKGFYDKAQGCGYDGYNGDMFCPHVLDWGGGLIYGVFNFYRKGIAGWKPMPIRN